jgi:hypothetical protein
MDNIDEKIKVTLLGGAGAGKTCYMIAMYKMMNYGIGLNGFSLTSDDSDENVRFGELWKLLVSQGDDRWPSPNSGDAITYSFKLYYAYQPVLEFDWFDYRGGALQDYKNVPDRKLLRDRLQETSCLLLCVSGEYLSGNSEDNPLVDPFVAREKMALAGMNQLLAETQVGGNNFPPAVVIVITKHDLCSHRKSDEILKDIKDLFAPLFATGGKWLVMICPVTLGSALADNAGEGRISPENVHIPVVFSIFAELHKQSWQLMSMCNESTTALEEASEGFLSELINRKFIQEKREEVVKLTKRRDQIKNYIRVISKNIDLKSKVTVFFNGRVTSFHEFFE